MPNTPARSIRVSESVWKLAKAKAAKEHTTVSAVIVQLLLGWLTVN